MFTVDNKIGMNNIVYSFLVQTNLHWKYFPIQNDSMNESKACPYFDSFTRSHFYSFTKNRVKITHKNWVKRTHK